MKPLRPTASSVPRRWLIAGACGLLLAAALPARADALGTLQAFVDEVKTGRASFTQTVSSPDGSKVKRSSGRFEFMRPDRFRFAYDAPFEQLIVGDGQQVWLHDVDLEQVTVRPMNQALGATPAALLAGGKVDKDFKLEALPDADGQQWLRATPRVGDSGIQSLKIAFRGKALSEVEILDAFGQRSRIVFSAVESNPVLAADRFRFTPPKGADVLRP